MINDSATKNSTPKKYKVIGTRPVRHDGVDKVTGRAKYGADISLSGMLHAAVLRSPHAHAKIVAIDTSRAEALPGVYAVMTSADLPDTGSFLANLGEGMFDLQYLSRNLLAREKVLYVGHAVAAVAAENVHIAEEAAKLIEVQYELLTPVLTLDEALQKNGPIVHDDLQTKSFVSEPSSVKATGGATNIGTHYYHEQGDLQAGWNAATAIVEREFTTSPVHQGYIEPHTATAFWNLDGQLTVWTSTQGAFVVRDQLSGVLQYPLSKIKVVPMEIGGGFGGKIVVYLAPLAAVLSQKSGRPVKMVMDRADVLQATGPTPGSRIRVKLGLDANGIITAADAEIYFEDGAFPESFVAAACRTIYACYDVPNGAVNGYGVCVNKPITRAYRAPGSTHAAFAFESVLDELGKQLQIDPLELRLKNAAKKGTRRIDGVSYDRIGMVETVEAIQQSEHWNTPLEEGQSSSEEKQSPLKKGRRGRGVASGFWFNDGSKSALTATVNLDGSVALIEGSTDIGGSRAAIAMQFAETLGIAAEDVIPTVVDTDSVGYNDVTAGSRVTYATGWAAYEAALDIKRQMTARIATIWDVAESEVRYENACFIGPKNQQLTFKEAAYQMMQTGDPVVGRGTSSHNEPGGAFGTHCVDVEIDPDTGKVTILRYTIAQDAGTAIHPSYVEGQFQGGVVQGIGWALNEEYIYDAEGRMQNSNFLDYRMPTAYDVPMIDTIIVEVPNPGHPYGVRGVGEVPIVPPPAAIANAIEAAIGKRMQHLPMSPPRVMHELLKS